MLEQILSYAELGWLITPPVGKNKVPNRTGWQKLATSNKAIITSWYKKTKDTGVGVLCGKESGILVIDLDTVKPSDPVDTLSGTEQLELIEMELGIMLPRDTVCEKTQGGGYHYFFKYPSDRTIRKSKLGKIDILGDGAYVMTSPSIGEKGVYEWINSPKDTDIKELPVELLNIFDKEYRAPMTAPVAQAVVSSFKAPDIVPDGARDDTLTRFVGAMVHKTQNYDELLEQAKEYNKTACKPPLPDRDIEKIVKSVSKIHNRKVEAAVLAGTGETTETIDWLTFHKGQYIINEPLFAKWFVRKHHLVYVNEQLYGADGMITDSSVKNMIQDIVACYVPIHLDTKVKGLLNVVKNHSFMVPPPINKHHIHFKDTTYNIKNGKMQDMGKVFSLFRLKHNYNSEATCPNWLRFLNELMQEDDIKLLQQYMGYLFVPMTSLQQALFICGNGGEGKSRISVILAKIFENNLVMDSIGGIESDKFMFATLDNKLLFVDDDMSMNAFDETEKLKKLIVAETKMQLEPKGLKKYEAPLFCRIVGIGNGFPQAKYDKSDGFSRRIRPIRVKPIPEGRIIDRNLQETLNREIDGIIAWAIEGLLELINNNYDLRPTDRQNALQEEIELESNNIKAFILDELIVERGLELSCSNNKLYRAYENWCHQNGFKPNASSTVTKYLKANQNKLKIQYTEHLVENGKRTRGFKGLDCTL